MKYCSKLFLFLVLVIQCHAQWIQQVSTTARDLFGIDMLDINTGFVCGDQVGKILKTTNGGFNWIGYTEPIGDQFNAVSFIDANTGIAVGPPGIVLRTSNGGINWVIVNQPGGDKGPVQFVSQNVAYAAGDDVIKTTNGGLSWFIIRNGTILSQYQGLYFIDENTGTVVGRPGLIVTTTNGGSTWIQRTMHLPVQFGDSTLYDIQYVSSQVGYTCGNNAIVMKTTNGGINWVYKPTGILSGLYGLYFTDENTGTIVGNTGRIMRTTNSGANWINQSLTFPLNSPLNDVEFVDVNTGWVVGFNGIIVKTTNSGITWLEPISSEIPNQFKLEQNYPNPFNPQTKIRFSVPFIDSPDRSKLIVYDALGKEVTILINEELNPGVYEVEWDGTAYASGIYYYTLTSSHFSDTRKMVLIK